MRMIDFIDGNVSITFNIDLLKAESAKGYYLFICYHLMDVIFLFRTNAQIGIYLVQLFFDMVARYKALEKIRNQKIKYHKMTWK